MEAIGVFSDELALTNSEEIASGEQRFVTLGMGTKARVLVVVYTWRGDGVRIISARPAERHEREQYEAQR